MLKKLKLELNNTDVSSDNIDEIINSNNNIFKNLKVLEVDDRSKNRGTIGIFINLLKKFSALEELKIKSNDRNVNMILIECLPFMTKLREVHLSSVDINGMKSLQKIKKSFSNIEIFNISSMS